MGLGFLAGEEQQMTLQEKTALEVEEWSRISGIKCYHTRDEEMKDC
jgi:hypothetical protein